MNDRPDLVEDIGEYSLRALKLEGERKGLVSRILDVVESEIIPEISPDLPRGYSISFKDSEVIGVRGHDEGIPVSFEVELRVHYRGKPITTNSPHREEVYKIQRRFYPKCAEIAKKYNLSEITLMAEEIILE